MAKDIDNDEQDYQVDQQEDEKLKFYLDRYIKERTEAVQKELDEKEN